MIWTHLLYWDITIINVHFGKHRASVPDDNHPANFGSAGADVTEFLIQIMAGDSVFRTITASTMDLYGIGGYLGAHFAAVKKCCCGHSVKVSSLGAFLPEGRWYFIFFIELFHLRFQSG